MWHLSGYIRRIKRLIVRRGRRTLYLYGDSAYHSSFGVMAPFKHHLGRQYLTKQQQQFNKRLSQVRIEVEHLLGYTTRLWTYNVFEEQLHLRQQTVACYFMVAALLTNCFCCLRGYNQTSKRFGLKTPDVWTYLCRERTNPD